MGDAGTKVDIRKHTIVVLGCAVQEDGTPSPLLLWRLEAASAHFDKLVAASGGDRSEITIYTTGGAVKNKWEEGTVMREWLLANNKNIDPNQVIAETRAVDTLTNFENVADIVATNKSNHATKSEAGDKEEEGGVVYLITSKFHVARARLLLEPAFAFQDRVKYSALVEVPAVDNLTGAALEKRQAWEIKCIGEQTAAQQELHASKLKEKAPIVEKK